MASRNKSPKRGPVTPHPLPKTYARLFAIAAVIALIGLADAVYLTVEHLAGANVACGESTGCNDVLSSSYSAIGKVPLAALGALAYFAAFSAATLAAFGYRRARPFFAAIVALMFAMTLWLLYAQAFLLHAFCRYCLLSAALTFCLAAIAVVTFEPIRRSAR